MAKKKQMTPSPTNKVSDNGKHPVPAGLEEEVWESSTAKPEPQQESWTTDETGEPVGNQAPTDEETEAWAQAVATDGPAEPWNATPEDEPVDPSPVGFLSTDEEEAQATADANLNTLPDWEAQQDSSGAPEDDWTTPQANFTLNIQKHTGKFDPSQAKILIYGDTGTQKTRTACTFPNALVVDVDHGMSSVDWEIDKQFIPDNEDGFKLMEEVYRMLEAGGHGYETVILDTLNEMQRVIMRFTVEEYTSVRRSYGSLPGQSDYGFMLYQFIELTRKFISLPMRVVLLAQVNSQAFETDILGPQLIGKNSARDLNRKMDIIGYIYKAEAEEGTVPEITFDATNYMTKDRSNKLPTALRNPTYKRISAYWK